MLRKLIDCERKGSIRLYSSITFLKKVLSFYQKALTQNFNLCLFSLVISPTVISVKLFVYVRNFVDSVVDKGLEKKWKIGKFPKTALGRKENICLGLIIVL